MNSGTATTMELPAMYRNAFRIVVSAALLSGVSLCHGQGSPDRASSPRPNIVVVFADDIGLGDIGFYHRERTGKPEVIPTPNIDRLISEGMRFSDAHSAASLCAPSRFGAMTGNYSYRNYRPYGVWSPCADTGVHPGFTTGAEIARQGGYATAFIGKWGMGGGFNTLDSGKPATPKTAQEQVDYAVRTSSPNQYGFDYSFELPSGIQNAPFAFYENGQWQPLKADSVFKRIGPEQNMYNISRKHTDLAEYGDSNWDPRKSGPMLAQKAVEFIERHTAKSPNQPLYMYYCTQAVHIPHAPPNELDGVTIAGSTPGPHGDMIRELDVQVGMLCKSLKKAGMYENTLFIFTSDNGGLAPDSRAKELGHDPSNGLRGIKGALTEGGHRVPFIAVWPGMITAGTESDALVIGTDLAATIAELAGQDVSHKVLKDSLSLVQLFTRQPDAKGHEYLMHYVEWGGAALRQGDWKLMMYGKNMKNLKPTKLFNLEDNPTENPDADLINNPNQKERVDAMFNTFIRLLEEPSVED